MNKVSPGFVFGIIASIVLGFGIIAGVAAALMADSGLGYETAPYRAAPIDKTHAELDLSTWPDGGICHSNDPQPEVGWVTYCPSTSLEAPPNTIVTIVIKQYDGASGLYNDFFSKVQGTTDDSGNVVNTASYNGNVMDSIPAEEAAHTFTLQSPPFAQDKLYVSVPLLGVADDAQPLANGYPEPNVIMFSFKTGPAGTIYVWHCYVPCGNDRESPYGFTGPMSTTGYMAGTLTVTNY